MKQLGVTPSKNEGDSLISEALVARCLWESHWREVRTIFAIYSINISSCVCSNLYLVHNHRNGVVCMRTTFLFTLHYQRKLFLHYVSPISTQVYFNDKWISFISLKNLLVLLALNDIKSVRCLDLPDDKNPLPGLPYLVIEGVWRCHYLAFSFAKTRDLFMQEINSAIFSYGINDRKLFYETFFATLALITF